MKTIALYFLLGFCVSFILGAWGGWQERRNTTDEELLTETAVKSMMVTPFNGDPNQRLTVSYACDSTTFFTYDPNTEEQHELPHLRPVEESSILSQDGVERVFEAATGFKLFEIVRVGGKAESSGELLNGKRIATVAGSLSGYFA